MQTRGQGAIEYLLLIAAAVIVVAVVISFMMGTMNPVLDSGNRQTYDFLCGAKPGGLDTNSLVCGCYTCNTTKTDRGTATTLATCTALAQEKGDRLLNASKCGWS